MKNLIYSSIYINEKKELNLKIIARDGILFKKDYLSIDVHFDLFEDENIHNIINQIQNKIKYYTANKNKYKWKEYDITNIVYLKNITIFDNKDIVFTNINEESIIELLKKLYLANRDISFMNLNDLDKNAMLIDPIIDISNGVCHLTANIYSENGNKRGRILTEYNASNNSHESPVDYAKIVIRDMLLDSSSTILAECDKKDIVSVTNKAYLYEMKK